MRGERLNAYQKALAMREKKQAYHSYTAYFKALTEECRPLFDAYEAEPLGKKQQVKFDLRTIQRLKEHHERFNRQSPLTMDFAFYYDCQHEEEAERIRLAKHIFIERMEALYKNESELIQSIKGGLIEGIHYELIIEKNN